MQSIHNLKGTQIRQNDYDYEKTYMYTMKSIWMEYESI